MTGRAEGGEREEGRLIAIEYKNGRQGDWLNDHIQLCAQAFCLEERQPDKPPLAYGYIFYVASRRRVQVNFTAELRTRTQAAIAQAFEVAALATAPPPLTEKPPMRCPHDSLLPLCIPDKQKLLQPRKGEALANALPD